MVISNGDLNEMIEILNNEDLRKYEELRRNTKAEVLEVMFKRLQDKKMWHGYPRTNRNRILIFRLFNETDPCYQECPYCINDGVHCRQHEEAFYGKESFYRHVDRVVEGIIGPKPEF